MENTPTTVLSTKHSEEVNKFTDANTVTSLPSFEEVILNTVNKKWLQIERDLKIIADATSVDEQSKVLQLAPKEMEGLVTLKFRSLKQFGNKKKHIRNKIKVSLSKNKHNYSLEVFLCKLDDVSLHFVIIFWILSTQWVVVE